MAETAATARRGRNPGSNGGKQQINKRRHLRRRKLRRGGGSGVAAAATAKLKCGSWRVAAANQFEKAARAIWQHQQRWRGNQRQKNIAFMRHARCHRAAPRGTIARRARRWRGVNAARMRARLAAAPQRAAYQLTAKIIAAARKQ